MEFIEVRKVYMEDYGNLLGLLFVKLVNFKFLVFFLYIIFDGSIIEFVIFSLFWVIYCLGFVYLIDVIIYLYIFVFVLFKV